MLRRPDKNPKQENHYAVGLARKAGGSWFREWILTLRRRSGFLRYFTNTSWLVTGNVIRLAINLAVGVYVARFLGPERYGELSFAIAYVGLFSSLSGLGLDSVLVREIVRSPEERAILLGSAFGLRLIGFVLIFTAVLLGLWFQPEAWRSRWLIMVIALGYLFQAAYVINDDLEARVQARYTVQVQLVVLAIVSFFQLAGAWFGAPLMYFACAMLLSSILTAGGLVWVYFMKFGGMREWRFSSGIAKKLMKDALPLIFAGLAIMVYMRIDQVMIRNMLGSEAVGYYAVAVKLSEAWYFVPTAVTASLFPAIINAKKRSETLYMNRLQRLHNLLVLISIVVGVAGVILAAPVIRILFGEAYMPAAEVLSIYVWAGLFVSLGMASHYFLMAEDMHWRAFFRTFSGMIINIFLNLVLIPRYGMSGAAMATLVSYAVAGYVYDLFDARCRGMFVVKTKALVGFWRFA